MVQYYILLKRKGAKKYFGVIRARKGKTLVELKKSIKKNYKNFTTKIITSTVLKRVKSKQ